MTAPTLPPAEQAQAAQAGLLLLTADSLQQVLPNLDPADSESLAAFTHWLSAVLRTQGQASAGLALQGYTQARDAAGVVGRFNPLPAAPPDEQDAQALIEWAVRPLLLDQIDRPAFDSDVTANAQKAVQDTGRSTVIESVHRDRAAIGWARIPEPGLTLHGTCSFCAMLAARGAVYKSERSASFAAHTRREGKGGNCVCHPGPVFHAYEPTAQVREWQRLWATSTRGRSGADARNAFRAAIEGREPPERRSRQSRQGRRKAVTEEQGLIEVTRGRVLQMRADLQKSIERSEGNPKLAGYIANTRQRLDLLDSLLSGHSEARLPNGGGWRLAA